MIWIIFPAWNEERVIRPTLLALWQAYRGSGDPYTAVLVDDGSTDRTVEQAKAAVAESGGELHLEVLSHEVNKGLGARTFLADGSEFIGHCVDVTRRSVNTTEPARHGEAADDRE